MPTVEQNLASSELGAKRIKLKLSPDTPSPTQGVPTVVDVDYADAVSRGGVVLPLLLQVIAPDGSPVLTKEFHLTPPTSLEFTGSAAGVHLVRLGEIAHNRWFGALQVAVRGEDKGED